MRVRKNQSGFSIVELLIILVIVCILGFVGYRVYRHQTTKTNHTATTSDATKAPATDNVAPAPQINSTGDLDKAAATLDQTDTNSDSDATTLDSQLQSF